MSGADVRPFLTAEWRSLLLVNYEVPGDLLEPHVPAGTELDSWGGKTLVSVVGFLFADTRLLGLAVPAHRTFEEVNLRFYVRRRGPDGGWRRGVVFLRELVPRRAIAWLARWAYNEPYRHARMRHRLELDERGQGEVSYEWAGFGGTGDRRRCLLSGQVRDQPVPLEAGSEAEYITEHYWGYTRQRDGGTLEYRVDHPRWRVAPLRESSLTGDPGSWYGEILAAPCWESPDSGYFAEGVSGDSVSWDEDSLVVLW